MSGTISFPSNPTDGQLYTFGGSTWMWSASKGVWVNANTGVTMLPLSGGTMTGPIVLSGDGAAVLNPASVQQSARNVGRSYIHNGLFNIAQRGAGPFTAVGYGLDRWKIYFNTDTVSFSQQSFGAAGIPGIDEQASRYMSNAFTGNAAASAATLGYQLIEGVKRLSNKTVTVSFYASANSGTPKLGVSIDQNFGTGGSPSGPVNGNGQSVTLNTTWQRFVLTFNVPSVAGMTLGTNGDDNTALNFWYSGGSSFNTRTGNVGVQSGAINLWAVQLEIGSVATPLEKPDPQQDLAKCQRFYETGVIWTFGYGATSGTVGYECSFRTTKRAAPTIAMINQASNNTTVSSVTNAASVDGFSATRIIAATGSGSFSDAWTASADL